MTNVYQVIFRALLYMFVMSYGSMVMQSVMEDTSFAGKLFQSLLNGIHQMSKFFLFIADRSINCFPLFIKKVRTRN